MSVTPRLTEVKKFMPVLEAEYASPEDAARAILEKAYELYEGQAKWYVVGQVKPDTGWKSPEEGRDSKVVLGPFGTEKQAEGAGKALAYSSMTGEESRWYAIKAWYGTPAKWYDARKKRWQTEQVKAKSPVETRQVIREEWMKGSDGAPLPDVLSGSGWSGLNEFQIWLDNTDGDVQDYDLRTVIRKQQEELNRLKQLNRQA